jgi:hypothetical protein
VWALVCRTGLDFDAARVGASMKNGELVRGSSQVPSDDAADTGMSLGLNPRENCTLGALTCVPRESRDANM